MGFSVGDTFPNVVLYDANGKPFETYKELEKGEAILLVSGSVSCPIARRKMPFVDSMQATFGDKIRTYIVYTIEAHPSDTVSPYRDSVWVTKANYKESVRITQARTFGERVDMAQYMADITELETPMLFDGPDNAYWYELGQAPVFAYLIRPDRVIAGYQKSLRNKEMSQCILNVHQDL
jgi:hypothetical protein